MAIEIGALRALLSLDSAAFEKGGLRAEASMGSLQKKLAQTSRAMKSIGKRMSLAISAPLAAAASVAVKSSLSTIDAQSKLAQSLGTSTKSIQALTRAADRAGVSQGELDQISRQLTTRLSEAASGGGPAADALERLGLTAASLSKMPLDEKIATINAAIEKTVPAAERAAVATDLFGSRAGLIAGRLDPATIAAASAEMERFGVAVSEVDADAIESANDAISALGLVSRGLANQIAVALAPTLQRVAEILADLGARFAAMTPAQKQFAAITATIAAVIGPLTLGLGIFVASLSALAPVFAGVAAAAALILSPIGLAVAAVAALAAGTVYLVRRFDSVGEAFAAFKSLARNVWDGIAIRIDGASLAIRAFALDVKAAAADFAADLIDRGAEAIRGLVDGFLGLGDKITAKLGDAWAIVQTAVAVWVEDFKTLGADLVAAIIDPILGLGDKAAAALASAWETIKAAVAGWRDGFVSLGGDLISGMAVGMDDTRKVGASGRRAARAALAAAADEAQVKSPSREWMDLGEDMVSGLAIGIAATAPATQAAQETAARVTTALSDKLRASAEAARAQADALRETAAAHRENAQGATDALERLDAAAESATAEIEEGTAATDKGSTANERLERTTVAAAVATDTLGAEAGRTGSALNAMAASGETAGAAIAGALTAAIGEAGKLNGVLSSVFDNLARGDMAGAVRGIGGQAAAGFGNLLKTSFTPNASGAIGGIGAVFGGIKTGITGIGTAFSSAASAAGAGVSGAIAGLGAAASAALPVIGAVMAGVQLIKGFSSSKTNHEFLRLTADEGGIGGVQGKNKTKTKFWGLSKKTKDHSRAWTGGMADMVKTEFADMREGLAAEMGLIGLEVEEFSKRIEFRFDPGTPDAQILQNLRAGLAQAGEEMIRASLAAEGLARDGEPVAVTLAGLVTSLQSVNGAFAALGHAVFAVRPETAGWARDMVELAGGIEAFRGSADAFYQGFYSADERMAILTRDVRAQVEALGQSMPQARAQFRDMIEALDTTTEGGRRAYVGLLSLSGAMDEVFTASEAAAARAQEAVRQAAAAAAAEVEAARQAADAGLADATRMLDAALSAEIGALRKVYADQIAAVSAAYDRQIVAVEAAGKAAVAQRQAALDVAAAAADLQSGILATLRDALRARAFGLAAPRVQLADASASLRRMRDAGRPIQDRDALREALRVVADPSEDLFGSFVDYQRDFARNTAVIGDLRDLTAESLSDADRIVSAIQRQIASIEAGTTRQVDALQIAAAAQIAALEAMRDAEIAALERMVAEAKGIKDAVISLGAAMRGFSAASRAVREANDTGGTGGTGGGGGGGTTPKVPDADKYTGPKTTVAHINSAYREHLGRGVDQAGLTYYRDQIKTGAITYDDLDRILKDSEEGRGIKKFVSGKGLVPAFAMGGTHLGGLARLAERDMELVAPSRVYSGGETRRMLDNGPVVAELRNLIGRIDRLEGHARQTNINTGRTARTLTDFDRAGLPKERA